MIDCDMNSDPREIESLLVPDGHLIAQVGYCGVTKIRPYQEAGQMAYVTWFAVYAGDTIVERVNSAGVGRIIYKRGE
jgi:hypothetical protein